MGKEKAGEDGGARGEYELPALNHAPQSISGGGGVISGSEVERVGGGAGMWVGRGVGGGRESQ